MPRRKYTRRKKITKSKRVIKPKKIIKPKKVIKIKKVIKPKEPPFIYGKIIPKGKIVHQYAPDEILEKFYFDKFDVMIEAINLKEAKAKIKRLYR